METSLSFKRALKWAYATSWGDQALRALTTLILASLLEPSEFGTVAIALIYILFIQMILSQGLEAALIQRKDLRPEHLDSVFWMTLVVSFLLVGVSIALSDWWAAANNLPELSLIIMVLSVSIPLQGLAIVQRALLQRTMNFKSLSAPAMVSIFVGGAVGVGLALKGFGIWALVAQQLCRDVVALSLLWWLSDWRPRWHLSFRSFKDLLGFSTAAFFNKLGVFANNQADALLIGLFFGPVAVGLYRLAEQLMQMVMQLTGTALATVSFPQFSRLQDRPDELRQSLLSCIRIAAIVTVPVLAGVAATSDLLMAVIGEKWADASDVLRILCVFGIFVGLTHFVGPLLQARSQPQYVALLTWILALASGSTVVLIGTLLKGASTWTQIVGVATARLGITIVITIPVLIYILLVVCRIPIRSYIETVAPSIASGVAAVLVVVLLRTSGLLHNLKPIISLALCSSLGGISGIAALLALDLDLRRAAREIACSAQSYIGTWSRGLLRTG